METQPRATPSKNKNFASPILVKVGFCAIMFDTMNSVGIAWIQNFENMIILDEMFCYLYSII